MMTRTNRRGVTLLTTVLLMAVLTVVVASVLTYATISRNRATEISRADDRQRCVQEGLQLAKSFFGRNNDQWNTYLGDPEHYNPIRANWMSITGHTPADPMSTVLQTTLPSSALFADLDGDGAPDVYIYLRDNPDESPPKWTMDNDGIVIVGAMCISSTMNPGQSVRGASCATAADCADNANGVVCIKPPGLTNGTCTAPLLMEAMIEYLGGDAAQYKSQANSGSKGTGNLN